jgi:hypothetical protein
MVQTTLFWPLVKSFSKVQEDSLTKTVRVYDFVQICSKSLIWQVPLTLAFHSCQVSYFITVNGLSCKHFEKCVIIMPFKNEA